MLVLGGVLLLGLATPAAAAGKGPGGYYVDMDGKKVLVLEYLYLIKDFPCMYRDSDLTVPLRDIRSLTLQPDGVSILLETGQGKRFTVMGRVDISYKKALHYAAQNPITGARDLESIDPILLVKIVLDWR